MGLHPVADRDDDVEVVELDLALDLTAALGLNRQGFLDGCRPLQLALIVDIPDVETDVLLRRLKQLGHLGLAQPDGLLLEPDLDARLEVRRRVEEQLRSGATRR